MSTVLSHRGFAIPTPQGSAVDGYIEYPLTDALYERVRTSKTFETDYRFLEDLVCSAKRVLFAEGGVCVLVKQLRTPASRWVHSFAIDTLRYLSGQSRRLAVENYRDLLVFHPKEHAVLDCSTLIRDNGLQQVATMSSDNLLSLWLSKDQGMADLATTLQLMGGSLPDNWDDSTEILD